ncbi:MAG TPA: DUF2891 domain-containing protein [Polyangiaceae bacterium]|jgi:hypothetical protein
MKVDLDSLARVALGWVHREYPNQVSLALSSARDVARPREITPAFYGSFDWHSAVHGHWTLARVARLDPTCASAAPARAALDRTITADNVAGELRNLERRASFERPYGLAWLLVLAQELFEWNDPDPARWSETLSPMVGLAAKRLVDYFGALTRPVRTGEHSQTAFALGLAIDWARSTKSADAERAFVARARAFHEGDRDAPLHREPSGADFLSPSLAEADVMRRVLAPGEFARWLDAFLPKTIDLPPAVSPNRADGRLAHLEGLNASRAWMLEGIASGLPPTDPRRAELVRLAASHTEAAVGALESREDSLTHWIASFVCYLRTRRGLA